jgi:hypothetical protein
MECLIIGINYIFPVKLLKISANGNSSRKNPVLFFLYNAFTKESETVKKKRFIVISDELDTSSNFVPDVSPLMGSLGRLVKTSLGKAVFCE